MGGWRWGRELRGVGGGGEVTERGEGGWLLLCKGGVDGGVGGAAK